MFLSASLCFFSIPTFALPVSQSLFSHSLQPPPPSLENTTNIVNTLITTPRLGNRFLRMRWKLDKDNPRMRVVPVVQILGHESQEIGELPEDGLFAGLEDTVFHTKVVFEPVKLRPATVSGLTNAEAADALWRLHNDINKLRKAVMGPLDFLVLSGNVKIGEGSVQHVD